MTGRKQAVLKKEEGVYHHGDLKSSLKTAALRLVLEKGPRGFSINEASRLAGVTVAAPYRHFADKDALLADIARDGFELLANDVRHAAGSASGWRERLLEAGMGYLRFSKRHSDYFAVMFNAGLKKKHYPELDRASENAFKVILDLATTGEKSPEAAMQRAVASWALVHGLATLSADGTLPAQAVGQDSIELRPILWQTLQQPFSM